MGVMHVTIIRPYPRTAQHSQAGLGELYDRNLAILTNVDTYGYTDTRIHGYTDTRMIALTAALTETTTNRRSEGTYFWNTLWKRMES